MDAPTILCLLWAVVTIFHVRAEHVIDLDLLQQLQTDVDSGKQINKLFTDFKSIFGRVYKDKDEEGVHSEIFSDRIRDIREHNTLYERGEKSYALGVNKFSDMTHQEFIEMYTRLRWSRPDRSKVNRNITATREKVTLDLKKHKGSLDQELPEAVDWAKEGYVTSIKDQRDCGSCWAFAVTGAVEGQLFKNTGRVVSLSAQQLVDCDYSNKGCDGGIIPYATRYIQSDGGLMSESEYPYKATDNTCQFNRSKVVPGTNVQDTYVIYDVNDTTLKEVVANVGPVIAGMDINPVDYMNYAKGVYYNTNCSNLYQDSDHAVIVVGYGTEPEDFWLIKNSMGTSWGEQGYMKIARNRGNNCGVSYTRVVYPVLGSAVVHYIRVELVLFATALSLVVTS